MKDEGRLQGKNLHPSPFNLQLKGLQSHTETTATRYRNNRNNVLKRMLPSAGKDSTE